MNLSRRGFLVSGGTLAASVLTPGGLLAALERQSSPPAPTARWSDIRAQFNLAPGYLHFSSFYFASHPRPVREAIDGFRRALDDNPFLVVEHGMFESEVENMQARVREEAAAYLGGRPDEVALTGSTTMGLALVYHGLALGSGDELLTTTHDHYSHHESIRLAAERAGARWRRIPLFERPERADADEIADRVRRAIRPGTRALGVTWVHSSSGVRLPIRRIAEVVSEINRSRAEKDHVLLIVDGVHGLGAVDETVSELGCDFFCAGTHKWLFGPRGTGVIWASAKNWERLRPTIPTFSELDSFNGWLKGEAPRTPSNAARVTPGGFTAFEHQWAMGAAFRFHRRMGRAWVAARIRELNDRCKEGLAALPRVTLHTPRDPSLSAGLACFEVEGLAPGDVVKRLLARRIVASTSPYALSYARLAPSLVNSPEEVDTALAAVRSIANV